MRIQEPTTVATDYVLGGLGVVWGWRLIARGRAAGRTARVWWGGSFVAMAVGAFAGGTAHGFADQLAGAPYTLVWKLAVYAVGVAGFLMLAGAAHATLAGGARRAVVALAAVKLAVFVGWMSLHDDFRWVIADYVPTLVAVAALLLWRRRDQPGAVWIAAGIAVSFAAAGVQRSGLTLHEQFNHNDLYHVIQMLGLWLLYRGGRLLRDRAGPAAAGDA